MGGGGGGQKHGTVSVPQDDRSVCVSGQQVGVVGDEKRQQAHIEARDGGRNVNGNSGWWRVRASRNISERRHCPTTGSSTVDKDYSTG